MKKNALATLAVLSIFVLSSCSGVVSSLFGSQFQTFEVGECVVSDELLTGEDLGVVQTVDCTEPHDAEVYAVVDSQLEEFDEQARWEEADAYCFSQFEGYVGTTYYDTPLYISVTTVTPGQEGWELGDRQIACLVLSENDDVNDTSLKDAAPFSEPGGIRYEVGECTSLVPMEDDEGEYFDSQKIDCEEPHQYEVFAVFESRASESTYDEELLEAEADHFCYEEFEPYVGIAYEDSKFYFEYLTPTELEWLYGLKDITCFILVDEDGEATGSVKDAGV